MYLKTKKMTDISQTQAGCKAKSRRNPLWIPRLFNAIPHNPALRLKHRFGRLRHGICVAKMLDNVGLRYPHRASGAKSPSHSATSACFGSLHPPLAALTFAASSIICAFGLASAAPRSPCRHLELCGIALTQNPAIFVEIDDIFDVSDTPFYYTGRPLFAQGPCLCYNKFI